jgi:hypothetical protein
MSKNNLIPIIIKVSLFAIGVIGLILIVIELTKTRKVVTTSDTSSNNTPPSDTSSNTTPPSDTSSNTTPTEEITLMNTINLLKNNNVKLLGSDKCGYTQAQLQVFSNKLQSSKIYMNCDNNACTPELVTAGLANGKSFNWPIWLIKGKVMHISTHSSSPAQDALSIEKVYNLVQTNV